MLDIFGLNYKKAALTFLQQHQVGQRLFSHGDGGRKMRYLREKGYVVSERVAEHRWVHTIVKKK